MATAFVAMNAVFGSFFRVEAEELFEPLARLPRLPGEFVFDVQTHHVAVGHGANVLPFRQIAESWNPALRGRSHAVEDVYLQNYVKEVFLDSDTDMVVLSGFPGLTEETNILPPEQIARSRAVIDGIAGSQRVLAHGLIIPDLGAQNLESMHAQEDHVLWGTRLDLVGLAAVADRSAAAAGDARGSDEAIRLQAPNHRDQTQDPRPKRRAPPRH